MIIDDFVMLGKTVPEANSDGRTFVCTAGYSFELREAMRIYPLSLRNCPARWSTSRIPLERNPKDSRPESWKIKGDRRPGAHERINDEIVTVLKKIGPEEQRKILSNLTVASLKQANTERRSLCVIFPKRVPDLRFYESASAIEMDRNPDLFGKMAELPVTNRFKYHPRISFADEDGEHNLQLRDWGCYELMRKNGDEYRSRMEEALNLLTSGPLLCGNFNAHRSSWLVISVFSGHAHARPEVYEGQVSIGVMERQIGMPFL